MSTSEIEPVANHRSCPNCGATVGDLAVFCNNCASPLNRNTAAAASRKKLVVIGAVAIVGITIVIGVALFLYTSTPGSASSTDSTTSGGGFLPSIPSLNPEQVKRDEAIRFCKLLNQKQPELNRFTRQETTIIAEIGSWAGQIAFLGGGGQQKSDEARSFSQRMKAINQQLSQIRKSLESETLNVAYNQTARSNIVSSLNQRERYLTEITNLLDQSADGLLRVGGFSYPRSIQQLIAELRTYSQPQDNITPAVKDIRTKFDITDSEITR
jgi:predicted nucleic acid-binding Zn ribbon protein